MIILDLDKFLDQVGVYGSIFWKEKAILSTDIIDGFNRAVDQR